MIKINPMRIRGNWKEGFALDLHTLKSEHIGDDEYGHPQFKTVRSEMGELLYKLKYNKDKSVLEDIITTASQFIKSQLWPVDLVVSVPPSRKYRKFQPVPLVAEGVAGALGLEVLTNCFEKVKKIPEIKGVIEFEERLSILNDAYKIRDPHGLAEHNILLIDDLYRSGATLNAITRLLKEEGRVKDVYILALTKTRRLR